MVYRTVICVLFVGVVVGVGLGCGKEDPKAQSVEDGDNPPPALQVAPPPYAKGVRSFGLEIIHADLIVRAVLNDSETDIAELKEGGYYPVVKYSFRVIESLKGTANEGDIVYGLWVHSASAYAEQTDAQARSAEPIAERDTNWDNREAVIFLNRSRHRNNPNSVMSSGFLETHSHYVLAFDFLTVIDNHHSIGSDYRRTWLPADSGSATGDDRLFLLTDPAPGTLEHPNGQSMTLSNIKQFITGITTEYNGGDGTVNYRNCVLWKYEDIERRRNSEIIHGRPNPLWTINPTLESGQVAGTTIAEHLYFLTGTGNYRVGEVIPEADRPRITLTGPDPSRFKVEPSSVRVFYAGTEYEEVEYDETIQTTRPLPAGDYKFQMETRTEVFDRCNYVFKDDFSITVTASTGTLHELFFDPVTLRQAQGRPSAVGVDGTNGVLKPATFMDANGTSATINSISYESGTVKLGVTPDGALAGHIVDFIELDGTVSLSLDVADATVDPSAGSGQAGTLSWSVDSQPWEDGDLLMVRIREAVPASEGVSVSLSEDTFTFSWSAITGAAEYRAGGT